jgi:hypothetical protein
MGEACPLLAPPTASPLRRREGGALRRLPALARVAAVIAGTRAPHVAASDWLGAGAWRCVSGYKPWRLPSSTSQRPGDLVRQLALPAAAHRGVEPAMPGGVGAPAWGAVTRRTAA